MIAAPVAASAAPVNAASRLSAAKSVRAAAPTKKSSRQAGASVIPIGIGAAVLAGVTYLIVDNENDDNSESN